MNKIILSVIAIIYLFRSCDRTEEYASATINGIKYNEEWNSKLFFHPPIPSVGIYPEYKAAFYQTILEPLAGSYPVFRLNFCLPIGDDAKLELNKVYKIAGRIMPPEAFRMSPVIEQLKEEIANGYDGIVYCCKHYTNESFLVEGSFELTKKDSETGLYHGSYMLINSPEEDEKLNIKCNFKFEECIY